MALPDQKLIELLADLESDRARPIPGSSLADLDTYAFTAVLLPALLPRDVLAENERSTEQRMAALRLTSHESVPTAAGILAVGVDPLAFVPGAYVQFLRLDGDGLEAPIKDEKRLDGTLLDVLRQLDELLELNISTAVDFTSGRQEERTADYPLVALQQVARNAVMHHSYEHTASPVRITWNSNRIEVCGTAPSLARCGRRSAFCRRRGGEPSGHTHPHHRRAACPAARWPLAVPLRGRVEQPMA